MVYCCIIIIDFNQSPADKVNKTYNVSSENTLKVQTQAMLPAEQKSLIIHNFNREKYCLLI